MIEDFIQQVISYNLLVEIKFCSKLVCKIIFIKNISFKKSNCLGFQGYFEFCLSNT